ncbi:BlaI/MecI/CopY family transcriptional regulator [Halobacterium salinarum]|uniref:BlaI/MecI/CopY family transcriptional regulator n=1 Tax=Halobacterium salinarum TaxID=2242 RepID=UPI00255303F5|nr:BlaI/MecI/CopY family transcriptional regulator [Halobacterium salinarum]MDL0118266.1 BlaI/MecI/CopY family transcriptional regulator [Halobacterium salinarum]
MGKSHENLLEVLLELDRYVRNNESFVTVSDLHLYMGSDYDMSERTVRRCLDEMEKKAYVESREVGNTTVYVVYDDSLLPDSEVLY